MRSRTQLKHKCNVIEMRPVIDFSAALIALRRISFDRGCLTLGQRQETHHGQPRRKERGLA
jgi:hypothetical protein